VVQEPRPSIDWETVDAALFAGRILDAIAEYRAATGGALREALAAVPERWQQLRSSSPERFTVPTDGYWAGFSS